MSVTEIGSQQGRYARLSDRFKSLWTYHQFAAGVFKNFLGAPIPYTVDFPRLFEDVKAIGADLDNAYGGVHGGGSAPAAAFL